jgi:twinkle protein
MQDSSSSLMARAAAFDDFRRNQVIHSSQVDVEKYLDAPDLSTHVKTAQEVIDEIWEEVLSPIQVDHSYTMPWLKTHMSFRFRPGEVTLYAGSNGGGKSLITGQIAMHLMKQNRKVCIASFEMKPKRTIYRMLRQFSGVNIDEPGFTSRDKVIAKVLERYEIFVKDRLYLYDQQGTTSAKQVIAMARYSVTELGITDIFVDSLMKCVPAEDDYNAQKYFVDNLTALARDLNVHVHLIHHIKKLQSEEVAPNKFDIKGSGAIGDQVDNVLLVFRNKKKEHKLQQGLLVDESEHDVLLMCEKQRNGEGEDWFGLHYHRASQQFVEAADSVPMSFDDKGNF